MSGYSIESRQEVGQEIDQVARQEVETDGRVVDGLTMKTTMEREKKG